MAHHAAVAKTSGSMTFFSTQSNVSGGLFPHSLEHLDEKMRANVQWTGMQVPALPLDELFANDIPDFIKMDIEGGEWDALAGARRLLQSRKATWLIELHDFGGHKPFEVIELMRNHGYYNAELAPSRVLFRPATLQYRVGKMLRRIARRAKRFLSK